MIAQHVVNVSVIVIKTSSDCRLCSFIRNLVSTQICNVLPFSAVGKIKYQMSAWVCKEGRREKERMSLNFQCLLVLPSTPGSKVISIVSGNRKQPAHFVLQTWVVLQTRLCSGSMCVHIGKHSITALTGLN